jgi:hypothetical protein
VRTTELADPVVRVVPAWKMNTELAEPVRVRGTGPVSDMAVEAV